MICKIIILLLIILIICSRKTIERFTYLPVLTLENTHVYDITNWKRLPNNILTSEITIKAKSGKIGYNNLMAMPDFGFPSLSGGNGYSNINKLQGTDGWQYQYEARHGNKWFWWYIVNKNEKEIKIKIILTGNSSSPVFPVSYNVKLPDYNHGILTRFWITFTHNPFVTKINNNNNSISQPLILDRKTITLNDEMWIKIKDKSTIDIPVNAIQGMIDYDSILDTNKETPTWFSWKLNNYNVQNANRIVISCKIDNNMSPDKLPVNYIVKIKDKNYNNHINYIITIT